MSLARSWRRALYGASGAALVVPATITGALAVLALAGGFAGVGAIGQAFSGPTLPASATTGVNPLTGPHASASLTRVLAAVGAPAPGAAGTLVAIRNGGGGPAAPRGRGGNTPVPSQSQGGSGSGAGSGGTGSGAGAGSGGATGTGTGTGSGSGSGGSPSLPTVVGGIVKTVTSAIQRIPGPVGSAGTNTVQSLGSTLNTIAPLRLPSAK